MGKSRTVQLRFLDVDLRVDANLWMTTSHELRDALANDCRHERAIDPIQHPGIGYVRRNFHAGGVTLLGLRAVCGTGYRLGIRTFRSTSKCSRAIPVPSATHIIGWSAIMQGILV